MDRYSDSEYWQDEYQWDVPTYLTVAGGPRYVFLLKAVHIFGEHIYPFWSKITQIYRDPKLVLDMNDPGYGHFLHVLLSRCCRSYVAQTDGFDSHTFEAKDEHFAASIKRYLRSVNDEHARAYDDVVQRLTEAFASGALNSYVLDRRGLFEDHPYWPVSKTETTYDFEVMIDQEPINEITFLRQPDRDILGHNISFARHSPADVWNGAKERTDMRFVYGEVHMVQGHASEDIKGGFRLYVKENEFQSWLQSKKQSCLSEVATSELSSSAEIETDAAEPSDDCHTGDGQMTVWQYIVRRLKEREKLGDNFKQAQNAVMQEIKRHHPDMRLEDIRQSARAADDEFCSFFRHGPQPDKPIFPKDLDPRLHEPYRGPILKCEFQTDPYEF